MHDHIRECVEHTQLCKCTRLIFYLILFTGLKIPATSVSSEPRETEIVSPEVKDPCSEISEEQIEFGISSDTELHTDPVQTDTTTETESSDTDTQSYESSKNAARR